jgi:hypothetical protein
MANSPEIFELTSGTKISLIFEISDLYYFGLSFILAYHNLFGIKGFVVVVHQEQ